METVPELKAAVGEATSQGFVQSQKGGQDMKGPFKEAFTQLMTCDSEVVVQSVDALVQ